MTEGGLVVEPGEDTEDTVSEGTEDTVTDNI